MDSRLQTFLTLCKVLNYRITAEELHMTQPAVTKQIQSLEQLYNTKLFIYDGKKLNKTENCRILEEYCESLMYNYNEIKKELQSEKETVLRIGATKTIGDYVLNPLILKYLSNDKNSLSLTVDNTENLLKMLDSSKIDFAVAEGFFSKKKYNSILFKKADFVGICPKNHSFAGKTIDVDEILKETLIVREDGSGTRDILEHDLYSAGYRISDFKKTIFISSFKLIRELVENGIGISFVYKAVIGENDRISCFHVKNFRSFHEFNIVSLKNTNSKKYIKAFFGKSIMGE